MVNSPSFSVDFIDLNSVDSKHGSFLYKKKSNTRKSSLRKNLFPEKYPSIYHKTRSVFSSGVNKIHKVFNSFKNRFESATQNLRFNNYKRYELDDYGLLSSAFQTPSRRTRHILGRTPTKMYSPFGIETPAKYQ